MSWYAMKDCGLAEVWLVRFGRRGQQIAVLVAQSLGGARYQGYKWRHNSGRWTGLVAIPAGLLVERVGVSHLSDSASASLPTWIRFGP